MGDVVFGYVHDFGTGEEWTATRGGGAQLDGRALGGVRPKEPVEILALEGTLSSSIADHAVALVGYAHRFRITGSLALSLCQLAAGRVDAVCSLRDARAVDIAAAQLLVREVGLAIGYADAGPLEAAPLDNIPRSPVVAAATEELRDRLAEILVM
jgi:myo-inositol-1(or 4)-monophosphatase